MEGGEHAGGVNTNSFHTWEVDEAGYVSMYV